MTQNTLAPWAELERGQPGPMPVAARALLALGDAGSGYELVEGVLVKMTPTGGGHGYVALDLGGALRAFVKPRRLGVVLAAETGFQLNPPDKPPDTVLAPDVAFVQAERVPAQGSPEWEGYWPLAPDLVVEVASPGQRKSDIAAKARTWLAAGTRMAWVVWPARRQVDVWRSCSDQPTATLGIGDALDGLDVLPGFTYPLADLFV